MSLSSSELKIICDELNRLLAGGRLKCVVQSSKGRLRLAIGTRDFHHDLLICLEDPFIRIHLTRASPQAKKTRFFFGELLTKQLVGFRVEEVSQVNEDRIAQLRFAKSGQTRFLLVELFRAKPNIYLLDENRVVIADWRREAAGKEYVPKPKPPVQATPPRFAASGSEVFNYAVDREYRNAEEEAAAEKEKAAILAWLHKETRKTELLLVKLTLDLREAEKWQELHQKGELLKSNLSSLEKQSPRVRLTDWSTGEEVQLDLDPSVTVQQNMQRMFERSKKLKRGLGQIRNRIRAAEEKLFGLKSATEQVNQPPSLASTFALFEAVADILRPRRKPPAKPARAVSVPSRAFTSREGFKIYVGRSAAENDRLSFAFARGRDLWFHARDFPGSHVVVRAKSRAEIGRETILDAANLALYYSKGKADGAGDVIYTERKYIARARGPSRGQVNVSRHRVIRIELDAGRIKHLKQKAADSSGGAAAD
jgi:predicted ribosome quality control (RQC) complex YloA/Tae2 family protein